MQSALTSLQTFLNGKKTYIASAVSVLTAILAYANNKQSLGTALTSVPGLMAYMGVIAAALRAALNNERAVAVAEIAKLESKVDGVVASVESKLPAPVAQVVQPVVTQIEGKLKAKNL